MVYTFLEAIYPRPSKLIIRVVASTVEEDSISLEKLGSSWSSDKTYHSEKDTPFPVGGMRQFEFIVKTLDLVLFNRRQLKLASFDGFWGACIRLNLILSHMRGHIHKRIMHLFTLFSNQPQHLLYFAEPTWYYNSRCAMMQVFNNGAQNNIINGTRWYPSKIDSIWGKTHVDAGRKCIVIWMWLDQPDPHQEVILLVLCFYLRYNLLASVHNITLIQLLVCSHKILVAYAFQRLVWGMNDAK